ncbi:MAG: molybdopterin-dependent oxidoreductase [Candidatus Korobacteraceae bacterium]|jgi:DMSO/TMAO reductase YedYZ molybdopterin-dependent catalytic subunit
MRDLRLDRRHVLSQLASLGGLAAGSRILGLDPFSLSNSSVCAAESNSSPELASYPQKTDLILLTDRPPQLETPLQYFQTDLTPNDAFFVRWHLSGIPTSIDSKAFRLEVSGNVNKPLSLSLRDLRAKFHPVSVVALCQCAGNGRSLFEPRVPGGQWGNGAMSNARWRGVRLKDVLEAAGVRAGSVQVGFHGLDVAPLPQMPRFEKSLSIDRARESDVLIAYEMNGAPLPMLNGFPLRLVVPGWYATYWVKSLSAISVLDKPLKTFWMDTAYRIPNNPGAEESPQHLAAETVPISRMSVHSIFVKPAPNEQLRVAQSYTLEGVANDGGSGIRKVEISVDDGKTWSDATLGDDLGPYSWRRWRAPWTPPTAGSYRILVRATANNGQQQAASQWNRSGYQRDTIEHVGVTAA